MMSKNSKTNPTPRKRPDRRLLIPACAAALAVFLVCLLVPHFGYGTPFSARLILAAVLTAAAVAALILAVDFLQGTFLSRRRAGEQAIHPILNTITLDFMISFYMPVILFGEEGDILWYNRAVGDELYESSALYGKNIADICSASVAELTDAVRRDGIDVTAFDAGWRVRSYRVTSQNRPYYITVWNDLTEVRDAYRRLTDEDTVVAYIIIDNLDELMQYVQEKYRVASSEIEALLKARAAEAGGILKEYERDKFLFLFDHQYLDQLVADKFDLLDDIRDIRVGEDSFPVTVSIGVADVTGSLDEKEKAAHAALDMALQRGGDQAVVKSADGLDIYGGRTKTVQKRTKVRARVVASELIALMSRSSNVLIMGHRNADFDSIGSCAGLARLAMFCGVDCRIIVNRGDPNLQKCFEKLDALPDFDGVLIDAAEAQDSITSETLLIISDVNNPSQFESEEVAENVSRTAIIDHHRKTAEFPVPPAVSYIEPSASSTCELVSEILEQSLSAGSVSKEIADLMFAGILLDTKQFTRNTGVRTFSAALYLRGEGADPADVQNLFRTRLDDVSREARIESNIKIYRRAFAIAACDGNDNEPLDRIAAAKAADKLLGIEGVLASFALCRIGDVIHISARSGGHINVQLILEKLNGGGHYDAAATQITGEGMPQVLTRLKTAIDEYLAEN